MRTKRLLILLLVLAVLTPLGLWLPQRFGAGDAWGEWSPQDLGEKIGFVPRGLARISELWKAPAPDYAPSGWEEEPLPRQGAAYIISAVGGLAIVGLVMWLLGRWLSRRDNDNAP